MRCFPFRRRCTLHHRPRVVRRCVHTSRGFTNCYRVHARCTKRFFIRAVNKQVWSFLSYQSSNCQSVIVLNELRIELSMIELITWPIWWSFYKLYIYFYVSNMNCFVFPYVQNIETCSLQAVYVVGPYKAGKSSKTGNPFMCCMGNKACLPWSWW